MWKVFGITTTTALALGAGIALLSFSPLGCACLSPKEHLALIAGLPYQDLRSLENYGARDYEAGLNKNLRGRIITPDDSHRYFLNCSPISETQFRCKEFTDESRFIKRGYEITISIDPNSVFKSAHVEPTWAWL